MQVIDTLIASTAILSTVWLVAEFIRFTARHRPAAQSARPSAPAAQPERAQFQHSVIPFQRRPAPRPTASAPSDRELIQLAKECGYPGSQKWSYSRPIAAKHRAILLETWEAIERTKAS